MKIFLYSVAFILGMTSIWMSHWDVPRTELAGKVIASVVFFILCIAAAVGESWYKERKRLKKIRGAVLSRPRATDADEPAKD